MNNKSDVIYLGSLIGWILTAILAIIFTDSFATPLSWGSLWLGSSAGVLSTIGASTRAKGYVKLLDTKYTQRFASVLPNVMNFWYVLLGIVIVPLVATALIGCALYTWLSVIGQGIQFLGQKPTE